MVAIATLGLTLLAPVQERTDVLDVAFSEVERRLICEHYAAACRQPRPDGRDVAAEDEDAGHHADEDGHGHEDKDKGKGKGKRKARGRGGNDRGLPPGLAKRDALPPGLQKQLDQNGRLPPGLEKRRLPAELHQRLPARGPEVEIVVVDRDVLLIQAATGLVYDIIADVVRN